MSDAVRRPCSDFMDMSRHLINYGIIIRIIIGSELRPETKQESEGKIDRFRSGRVRVRARDRVSYN